MSAVRLVDPQSLNLYAYLTNDPVNATDALAKVHSGVEALGFLEEPCST